MPKISIIVPVYRVEKYIHRCVDSILGQTFTDFELILVDDGSPDNCGSICDAYAAKDSHIKVIHKQNGGIASARNAGIDTAVGKWILFCDSDDCYHKDYLSEFLMSIDLNDHKTLHAFNFLDVWPDGVMYGIKCPAKKIVFPVLTDNITFVASGQSHAATGYAIWDQIQM